MVVKNGKIVGEGYNNVISRNDPTWCVGAEEKRAAGHPHGAEATVCRGSQRCVHPHTSTCH